MLFTYAQLTAQTCFQAKTCFFKPVDVKDYSVVDKKTTRHILLLLGKYDKRINTH